MSLSLKLALACSVWTLAGCVGTSSIVQDSNTGVINQIYTRYDLRYRAPPCLYSLSSKQISSERFVDVRILRDGKYKHFSAFVKGDARLETGAKVTFTSEECRPGAFPEVTLVGNGQP